ncbi:MAG: hypothetical protein ACYTDV_19055, partial [Planctomycetota bacterium]
MRETFKIDKLIKDLRTKADPDLDRRIDDLIERDEEIQPEPLSIWRTIMKSRKAQFTAAAVAVLITYLCLQIPKDLVAPAYALDETIEAYNSMRYLHVKAFRTLGGQKWDSESWIEFDEDGRPARFRNQISWISTEKGLGPATRVRDGDESYSWLPNLNLCFRRSGKSGLTDALL